MVNILVAEVSGRLCRCSREVDTLGVVPAARGRESPPIVKSVGSHSADSLREGGLFHETHVGYRHDSPSRCLHHRGICGFSSPPERAQRRLPVVAYNSTDHEYLVVWSEEFLMGSVWYNSVRAQRVAENGAMIGNLFTVITFAANPAVTYNSAANEYLVGGNPGGNYVCQRVSNTGTLVGSAVTIMNGVNDARILYNSIGGHYLAIGAALEETPAGSGELQHQDLFLQRQCRSPNGQRPYAYGKQGHGPQPEPAFGAAYAPMVSGDSQRPLPPCSRARSDACDAGQRWGADRCCL